MKEPLELGGGHVRLFPRGAQWAAVRLQQRYLRAVHNAGSGSPAEKH